MTQPLSSSPVSSNKPGAIWPSPTSEDLETKKFKVIWEVIKTWDINVPEAYDGYCSAEGNHVKAILNALETLKDGIERATDRLPK